MSVARRPTESVRPRVSLRHPPPAAVSVDFEVPFHDVDALQIVWHGHYMRYLDVARTALLRTRGLDVPLVGGMGYRMVVIETQCRYIFPLRYGERFRVTAWIAEVHNWVKIAYLIRNLSQSRRSARAHTVLVTTDDNGSSLWETPPEIRDRLVG